jgi:hypothetical protein
MDEGSPTRAEIMEIVGRGREAQRALEAATDTLDATLRVPTASTRAALGDRWLAEVPGRLARWNRLDASTTLAAPHISSLLRWSGPTARSSTRCRSF